ncbi:MAG: peptide-methionine (S)-S-oxide reductase MsrA [Vicinamibacterales bacterium]
MTRLSALLLLGLLPGSFGIADQAPATEEATLAGGCFWCLEEVLEKVPGVVSATSGYTGGSLENPTYEQVSGGRTGHTEAVRITFDPSRATYAQILEVFWRNVDPIDAGGQFCDRGSQYRAGIFVHNEHQRQAAESSRQAIVASGRFKQPIATEIVSAGPFYAAEDYHQDYYKKNPLQYRFYKFSCGRERRLEQVWGKKN